MSPTPATDALVGQATQVSDRVPATASAVGRGLLDTVAVALAARHEPTLRILLDHLEADEPAHGPAVLWGLGRRGPATRAALVNGLAAHALDWDDASPTVVMHPSAVLYPTVLALVDEQTKVTDLVDAIDAGNAVFRGVSEILDVGRHQDTGWHNTATTGRLAAVVAAARMRRLDAGRTACAIGVVASMMGGSLANFGTMTKPLHAGLAAHDGVRAVQLAARGFEARTDLLDHAKGFFAAFPAGPDRSPGDLAEALTRWRAAWPADVAVKRYPSCYGTHRAIDAALSLRDRVADLDRVETVEVFVHPGARRPLIDHLPTSGLEGKFSMEYTLARALVSGDVTLADFTDERVAEAAPLAARVRVVETTEPPATPAPAVTGRPDRYAVVRLIAAGHPPLLARVEVTHGDGRNPLDDADLVAKFVAAAAGVGRPSDPPRDLGAAEATAHRLLELAEHGPVFAITELLDTPDPLEPTPVEDMS